MRVEIFSSLDERLVHVEVAKERIMGMVERLSIEKHEAKAEWSQSGE